MIVFRSLMDDEQLVPQVAELPCSSDVHVLRATAAESLGNQLDR